MTRFDPALFRVYEPDECGNDGYPWNWHRLGDVQVGVKHFTRAAWGFRCERCCHPYEQGAGEWSPCDAGCDHDGPIRAKSLNGWVEYESTEDAGPLMVLGSVPVEARWRILTVHHLRAGHDAKRDLRWWNLTALCQRCHLTIQGRVLMDRVWPWPHTDWFRVHAAGFYAHAYEGRDISFEEAVERLDDLLAYELQVTS